MNNRMAPCVIFGDMTVFFSFEIGVNTGRKPPKNLMGGWRNDKSFFRKTICYSVILNMIVTRKLVSLTRFGA